jgi:exopolysaccharide biosynthesis protein
MMKSSKKTLIIRISLVVLVILGFISYLLADRYLIEHVEVAIVSTLPAQTSLQTTQAVQPVSAVSLSSAVGKNTTSGAATSSTTGSTTSWSSSSKVVSDDWNYQDANVSISIKKISTGSGNDRMVYFVADVTLKDATQLQNAFAKNEFGRNIIQYTSEIARNNNAIFAINGDYYGFRSDGIVIRNGVIYRNVPARVGLAFYKDGSMKIYDETKTTAQALLAAGVWNTLSFGPALIQNSAVTTNFGTVEVDSNIGNHTIQGDNPRTGIGIISPNHFVFVVVDGRSNGYSNGATLTEFTNIFKSLGCTDAYNIDGGGSSTMYFMGRVVNNPLGNNQERGTSDILFVGA